MKPGDPDDDDDDVLPRPKEGQKKRAGAADPGRALAVLGVLALLLVCLCGGGLYLARGLFVGYGARSALAARGIVCDDDFAVSVDASVTHADVSPCTCTMEEGPVASFTLVEPVAVELEGEIVTQVRAGQVRVSMRGEGPAVDAGSLGPLAAMLGVPARIGSLIGAASELAVMHAPATEIASLDVEQGGRTTVHVESLALDGASPLGITATEVSLPALSGPLGASATAEITGLSGTASASSVRLSGELALTGSAPIVGSVTRGGHVVVSGSALDTDAPSYRIAL